MNEFESEPGFLERYRNFLVSNGHLTAEQLDAAARKAKEIQALELLPGVYWGLTPQITSMYPKLLTSVKLKAQAAGFELPFKGVDDYITSNWPISVTRRTMWNSPPTLRPNQKLGSVFLELGLISTQELQQTLGIQQIIRDETGVEARLGVVLMRVARISLVDLLQVVGFQVGIPFTGVDSFVTTYEARFSTCACP